MGEVLSVAEIKPVFIPLKTKYYEAFCDGSKTVEYRRWGKRWCFKNCQPGRRVVISKGYGKKHRREGVIVSFGKCWVDFEDWIACYGVPGWAACVSIRLFGVCQDCDRVIEDPTDEWEWFGRKPLCESCYRKHTQVGFGKSKSGKVE